MSDEKINIPKDKVESIILTKTPQPFILKLKSVKLIMMILFTGLFTYLLYDKVISETSYVSMITILLLSYFGANVGSKLAKR